jgi:hypothetical protein
LSYRQGIHPFWSSDKSYDDLTSIEYLGLDIEYEATKPTRWNALLVDARSFENFFELSRKISWQFETDFGNLKSNFNQDRTELQINGGVGVSHKWANSLFYSLLHLENSAWQEEKIKAMVAPGFLFGWKFASNNFTYLAEVSEHWWHAEEQTKFRVRANKSSSLNDNISIQFEEVGSANQIGHENKSSMSWAHFF